MQVRPATEADNDAICRLFASITMESDLGLAVHREPDFNALYKLQVDSWNTWVGELDNGELGGVATMFARDGYLGGARKKIGYLGDLRVAPNVRGKGILQEFYGPVLREYSLESGCDEFLTGVIASNKAAIRALTGDTAKELGIPPYTLIREFDIRALHFTMPLLRRKTEFEVDKASEADIGALAKFLDVDGRGRPFGYVFDEAILRQHLKEWPDLSINDFYIARDRSGEIVGCLAVWDAIGVKQTEVTGYRGNMRRIKLGYNVAATIGRFAKLPNPGSNLQYLYATHFAIPSEDPRIMRSLLDSIYRDRRRSGNIFLSCCVFANDKLEPAFKGFITNNLRAHLYVVTLPEYEIPEACFAPERPAFEMAMV